FATLGEFHVGSYGEPIHEMLEARDVRMGQYGHSNQPSHHIVYMYDVAGQPWKTQDKVRDALSRLYVGSEIGQGYPGDEDNGEMSAWYLFSAAGFYPLRMGTPAYVIGAPYFPHMDIALANGRHIVIDAPAVSANNRYVSCLRVTAQPWNKLTMSHALLAQGATLEFLMGPTPSRWASDEAALPPSLTPHGRPQPLRDPGAATSSTPTIAGLPALFDNDSASEAVLPATSTTIAWHYAAPGRPSHPDLGGQCRRAVGLAAAGFRRRPPLAHAAYPPTATLRLAAADPGVRRAGAGRVRALPAALRRGTGRIAPRPRRNRTARTHPVGGALPAGRCLPRS